MRMSQEPDRLVVVESRLAGIAAICAALAVIVVMAKVGPGLPPNPFVVWKGFDSIVSLLIGVPLCLLGLASIKSSRLVLDRVAGEAIFSTASMLGKSQVSCRLDQVTGVEIDVTGTPYDRNLWRRNYLVLIDGGRMSASPTQWFRGWARAASACAEFLGVEVVA